MSKRHGLEHLKKDYPVFLIKNRTSVTRSILLANNEEVMCQPAPAETRIAADELLQIPDFRYFTMLEPDMSVLAKYGLLNRESDEKDTPAANNTEEPVEDEVEVEDDTDAVADNTVQ